MSLLQFEDEIMPFTFCDILILRYLFASVDAKQTVIDFNIINDSSNLGWSFSTQLKKFIRRFFSDPYRNDDTVWINELILQTKIEIKEKLSFLSKEIKSSK